MPRLRSPFVQPRFRDSAILQTKGGGLNRPQIPAGLAIDHYVDRDLHSACTQSVQKFLARVDLQNYETGCAEVRLRHRSLQVIPPDRDRP
jgi:hypothetical protein